jgi:predicted transcriptional regulator of viral defense system
VVPADADEKLLHDTGLGAFFRPSQLREHGITYGVLQRLVTQGTVERLGHGLYHLAGAEPTENYSIAAVCAQVPRSVVCLLSALKVHGIGTQIPRDVWIAIPHKARAPRIKGVRIRLVRFSGAAWTCGVEESELEGVPAHITSPARTVVDCFRFQRLVGGHVAIEALRAGLRSRKFSTDELYRTLEALPSKRLKYILETGAV